MAIGGARLSLWPRKDFLNLAVGGLVSIAPQLGKILPGLKISSGSSATGLRSPIGTHESTGELSWMVFAVPSRVQPLQLRWALGVKPPLFRVDAISQGEEFQIHLFELGGPSSSRLEQCRIRREQGPLHDLERYSAARLGPADDFVRRQALDFNKISTLNPSYMDRARCKELARWFTRCRPSTVPVLGSAAPVRQAARR